MTRAPRISKRGLGLAIVVLVAAVACEDPINAGVRRVHSVVVSPDTLNLAIGEMQTATATAADSLGVHFVGPTVVWTVADPSVAFVSGDGTVTATLKGNTTLEAMIDTMSGTATLLVTDPPIIAFTPSSLVFSASVGGANPAEQIVAITNAGEGLLSDVSVGGVSYAAGSGWLTSGLSENPLSLVVRPIVTGLSVGTYSAVVDIRAPRASNSPAQLQVTLTVVP